MTGRLYVFYYSIFRSFGGILSLKCRYFRRLIVNTIKTWRYLESLIRRLARAAPSIIFFIKYRNFERAEAELDIEKLRVSNEHKFYLRLPNLSRQTSIYCVCVCIYIYTFMRRREEKYRDFFLFFFFFGGSINICCSKYTLHRVGIRRKANGMTCYTSKSITRSLCFNLSFFSAASPVNFSKFHKIWQFCV